MSAGATLRSRAAAGFTLIEIIVVLVVLGLILSLVIADGPAHSQRLDLDAAAENVVGMLRSARSRAIAEDQLVTVAFDAGGYRVDNSAFTWAGDVRAVGDRMIKFTPDGGSSGGGIILLGGGRQIAIYVDWLTARVHIR